MRSVVAKSIASGMWSPAFRSRALSAVSGQTEIEKAVTEKLTGALQPIDVSVQDKSGGCGAMFEINITAEAFKGLSTVKQHQLVHKLLSVEIASWHGLSLKTKPPPS
eukprot:gene27210-2456_t